MEGVDESMHVIKGLQVDHEQKTGFGFLLDGDHEETLGVGDLRLHVGAGVVPAFQGFRAKTEVKETDLGFISGDEAICVLKTGEGVEVSERGEAGESLGGLETLGAEVEEFESAVVTSSNDLVLTAEFGV